MSRKLAALAVLVAIAALAFAASATSSAGTAQTTRATAATGTTTQVGAVTVTLTVNRFVKRGKRLYAVGTAISQFKPTAENAAKYPSKTVRRAFTAPVRKLKRIQFQSAQRICPVLDLTLGPLDLNLLGLMVHLDKTRLTITADSNGGLLGSLLCSIAGRGSAAAKAAKLTKILRRSGLATRGIAFAVPLQQTSSGTAAQSGAAIPLGPAAPARICPVLDLTLGPLDLNLLGLMVHLDTVHLVITADSEGGILGALLCALVPPTP